MLTAELLPEDLQWCLTRLPKRIINMMEQEREGVILAGGFIRTCIANEQMTDIDLFSKTKADAERNVNRLKKNEERLIITENAYTIVGKGPPIQFITRWVYDNPIDVIPSFDFTIARAAIWCAGSTWKSCCDSRFYADLAAKRLVYCSPERIEETGGSLLRVLKFYQKGYRIPLDSLAKTVARAMSGINFKKAYDEESWAFALSGLLREVDPSTEPSNIPYFQSTEQGE